MTDPHQVKITWDRHPTQIHSALDKVDADCIADIYAHKAGVVKTVVKRVTA